MALLTHEQMRKLINKINCSTDATPTAKIAIIWVIRRANELGCGVALGFTGRLYTYSRKPRGKFSGIGPEVSSGVHDMRSDLGTTHIGHFLKSIGVNFELSTHCKTYNSLGVFDKNGFTIWFAPGSYNHESAKYVVSTRNEAHLLGLLV